MVASVLRLTGAEVGRWWHTMGHALGGEAVDKQVFGNWVKSGWC